MPEGLTNYTVRSGETFGSIAKRFGLSFDELAALNPQFDAGSRGGGYSASEARKQAKLTDCRDVDYIRANEKIQVPLKGAPKPVTVAKRSEAPPANARVNVAPPRSANPAPKPEVAPAPPLATKPPAPIALTITPPQITLPPAAKVSDWTPDIVGPQPWAGKAPGVTADTIPPATQPALMNAPAMKVDTLPPKPPIDPNEVTTLKDKPHNFLFVANASGSGSKDAKSADNRVGLVFEHLDTGPNPNAGPFQFSTALTSPGRVQDPDAKFDAAGRVTVLSIGRKPLTIIGADGNKQNVENVGWKLGWMKSSDRIASVSVVANASGVPVGSIAQENGRAVAGKSTTSPMHVGLAGSLFNLQGFYAAGIGTGAVRNTVASSPTFGKISDTRTAMYGADMAVPFDFKSKVRLDKVHFGITGTKTTTTPREGIQGAAPIPVTSHATSAFVESYFKFPVGNMPSILPERSSSKTFSSVGTFRARFESTTNGSFNPRLTFRTDIPVWESKKTEFISPGNYSVKSQTRIELYGLVQVGRMADNHMGFQNFLFGAKFKF